MIDNRSGWAAHLPDDYQPLCGLIAQGLDVAGCATAIAASQALSCSRGLESVSIILLSPFVYNGERCGDGTAVLEGALLAQAFAAPNPGAVAGCARFCVVLAKDDEGRCPGPRMPALAAVAAHAR